MLAGNSSISDDAKIGEVARQFEAVLLRQILSEARKPESGDPTASGIYNDMINNQLADTISRSGHFSLAKSLKSQLSHQVLPHGGALPQKIISTSATNSKHK